jgi:hypothetical protein
LESLQTAAERVMCEFVRVKPNLQWKPQDVEDDRNVKHLPSKVAGTEWSQVRREATWTSSSKVIGLGLPKHLGAHIMTPHALDANLEATGFSVCPAGYQPCLSLVSLCCSILPCLLCTIVSWKFVIL